VKRCLVPLALCAVLLAGCGYKGDLVAPERAQDEKAGQVKPEPIEESPDDAG
jgi:predicted small lipoprotein YifL